MIPLAISLDMLMGMGTSILVVLSLFYYYERKNWKDEKLFLLEDIEKLKSNLGEAQSISNLSKELAIKEKEISSKEAELKNLVQEIKDTEEQSNREKESMQAGMQKMKLDMDADEKNKRAELSKLESEINQKREEVENLKDKLSALGKEELNNLEAQIKEKQMALQNINDEYTSSKEKLMEAAKKEVEEEKQRQLARIETDADNQKQKLSVEIETSRSAFNMQEKSYEDEIVKMKAEIEKLKEEKDYLNKGDSYRQELDNLETQIKEKQAALQSINDEYTTTKEELMESAKEEAEKEGQRQLSWIMREIENERSKSIAEKERIREERIKFRKEYEEEYSRKKVELDKIKKEMDYLNRENAYEDELKYLEAKIHARREELKKVETEYSDRDALIKKAKEEVEEEKRIIWDQMEKELEKKMDDEINKAAEKLKTIRENFNKEKEGYEARAEAILDNAWNVSNNIINNAVEKVNSILFPAKEEQNHSFSEEIMLISCGNNFSERFLMKEYQETMKAAKFISKLSGKTKAGYGFFSTLHEEGIRWIAETHFDVMAKKVIDNCLKIGYKDSELKIREIAKEIYTKSGYSISIKETYLNAMIDVLKRRYELEVKKQKTKEEEAQERERIREEEKAQRDYERAIKQAQKDEEKARRLLEETRRKMEAERENEKRFMELSEQNKKLEQALQEAIARGERAKSMAEQTRHGYVYVISNIGSFGEDVYKIGLTRRLDPLDRVRELGDASVPFPFDVHAIIESEDAPALEAALHRIFDAQKMNKMNWRKEFFRVSLDEIEKAVIESGINATFIKECPAQQYRDSLLVEKGRMAV